MPVGFPVKVNYATGDILTATNMNDLGGTVNLLESAQYAAGKNKIMNGDFSINQRNFTSTTTTGTIGFDRFGITVADGTSTYSAQTFTPGTAPVAGYEAANFARLVTTGQTLATAQTVLSQSMENVRTLAGQTATVSFWAKAASGTPKIAVELNQVFGSGGSPSSAVPTYAGQVTLSTAWARYSVTVAVPSITGKTIGTNPNSSSIGLNLWVSAGSNFNARTGSLGIQSNTFDIWGVQVENGSTASPFQTASGSIAGELALCQRYYYRNTTTLAFGNLSAFSGISTSTTSVIYSIQPPVPMRVTPNALEYSTLSSFDGATGAVVSNAAFSGYQNANAIGVTLTVTGATAQRPHCIIANNSTSAYIAFSADL